MPPSSSGSHCMEIGRHTAPWLALSLGHGIPSVHLTHILRGAGERFALDARTADFSRSVQFALRSPKVGGGGRGKQCLTDSPRRRPTRPPGGVPAVRRRPHCSRIFPPTAPPPTCPPEPVSIVSKPRTSIAGRPVGQGWVEGRWGGGAKGGNAMALD